MGKSATANMLRALGVPVFDSDACVHGLLATGGAGVKAVVARFPECWDKQTDTINRQILGKVVFGNKAAKKDLESILHPLVWKAQRNFLAKSRRAGHKQVVLDIPLLYETGSHRKCDRIICVTAPAFVQQQRVLKRPGMTMEKLASILDGQLPDIQKRKMSDHVIHTGLGRAATLQSLKKALRYTSALDYEAPQEEQEE